MNNKLHDGNKYIGPLVEPGQKLFMPIPWYDIVVPVVVWEVSDIYYNIYDTSENHNAIWMETYLDGVKEAGYGSSTEMEKGWPKWVELTQDQIAEVEQKSYRHNQYLWVDEPVGHSLQIYDELFFTLDEALKYIHPTNKKHLKRRLRASRGGRQKFIAATWEMNGEKHPGFNKLPDKKVYVRRG